MEHPFFVFGKGWSSLAPRQTLQRYGLPCHKLAVDDVCIYLTHSSSSASIGSSTADESEDEEETSAALSVDQTAQASKSSISVGKHKARKTDS